MARRLQKWKADDIWRQPRPVALLEEVDPQTVDLLRAFGGSPDLPPNEGTSTPTAGPFALYD